MHVLRAPLGGLFRHVVDLTELQIARGHQVGLVTDSTHRRRSARPRASTACATGSRSGILRVPMRRLPHPSDLAAPCGGSTGSSRALQPDVVHGHGAKGGLYARAPASAHAPARCAAYTPHGGSFNYRPGTLSHRAFMGVEAVLARGTDLLLFESDYIAGRYDAYVGATRPAPTHDRQRLSEAEFAARRRRARTPPTSSTSASFGPRRESTR